MSSSNLFSGMITRAGSPGRASETCDSFGLEEVTKIVAKRHRRPRTRTLHGQAIIASLPEFRET